jgi:glycine dehydrogenase subunit 2
MKYNSRLNEKVARIADLPIFIRSRPNPNRRARCELIYELQEDLAEITGLPGVSVCSPPPARTAK